MIAQRFKGDAVELQMEAAGIGPFQVCGQALDDFDTEGFEASPFLLMLYDEGRMPFSDRVPRDSFVAFFIQALAQFPFTGTFESYIFILNSIFGAGSGVLFDVPGPGKLDILVNASASIEFDLVVSELIDGGVVQSNLGTSLGDSLVARGISGIDSEYQLKLLLSELIPNGIYTEIALAYFALYSFVDELDNGVVDFLGNQIVFIER